MASFSADQKTPQRYIRLRSTEANWSGYYKLELCNIKLFGKVYESI